MSNFDCDREAYPKGNRAKQELSILGQQPLPQPDDCRASQQFETQAKSLQAILESNPSLRFDVAYQIQQTISRIRKSDRLKDAERLLELYLIEIETFLPALISDRFIASWLWSNVD